MLVMCKSVCAERERQMWMLAISKFRKRLLQSKFILEGLIVFHRLKKGIAVYKKSQHP
jgi:CRISPR/Cas system-associated protein endoribonuclease Cas2